MARRLRKREYEVDLEDYQVRNLLRVAEVEGMEYWLCWAYLIHGLRFGEAVGERALPGIHMEDFYWQDGLVKITGKGYQGGLVQKVFQPVHSGVLEATREYRSQNQGKLFTMPPRTFRYHFKRQCKRAEIPGWEESHPHRLRHWFSNAVRPHTRDAFELMDLMRHSKKSLQRVFGATVVYVVETKRRRELTLKALEPILG